VSAERVLHLDEVDLEPTCAHAGEGLVSFRRLLSEADFRGPWNFVDYAVLPPGASIGRHTHGGNEELYLVLEGQGSMHLDGREFPVRAGHVVVNRPGGTHGLVNDSDAPLRLFVVEVACGTDEDRAHG
jgi:mannose-6-phosphate isomerase-like protein (cupin superfamily)